MRILLLVEVLTVGGLPNYVLDLARALAAAGDDVAVAHGGEAPSHLDVAGVRLLSWPEGQAVQALQAVRAWNPDVVHVHLCSDTPLVEGLATLGVPLLRSFHDYTSMCLRRGRRRYPGDRCQRALSNSCVMFGCAVGAPRPGSRLPGLHSVSAKLGERAAYQRFDAAVVGSRHMRKVLITNGFAPERVHLVPYFSRFDAIAQGQATLPPKPAGVPGVDRPLSLLFSGQAVAGKGLKVLVRALAGLDGDWRLNVLSDGPELGATQALARRLGLDARIHFLGWLPHGELLGLYRNADLLVVPSVWDDPGPLVGLEALSLQTPVLGFPVGGIPDYTLEGRTGFLAEAVSVAALSNGLRRAMSRGADLAGMGRAGSELVAQAHGRAAHIEHLRSLYRLAREARPARATAPHLPMTVAA